VDDHLAGPLLHRDDVEDLLDLLVLLRRGVRGLGDLGRCRLTEQERADLHRQECSDPDEHETDRAAPDPVPAPVAGHRREDEGEDREDEAEHGSGVLPEHDDEVRVRRVLQVLVERLARASLVELLDVRQRRVALEQEGDPEDPDAEPHALDRLGVLDLVDALVDGERAAAEEQHQGDHERPEVDGAPVAERMGVVGRLLRLTDPDEEEDLVAAVRERVERLGQHRPRLREDSGDGLHARDQ
jgi:hypothetical protein